MHSKHAHDTAKSNNAAKGANKEMRLKENSRPNCNVRTLINSHNAPLLSETT